MIFPINFSITVITFDQLDPDTQGHITILFIRLHFSEIAVLPPEKEASTAAGPRN